METHSRKKLILVGSYLAEVDVEYIETEDAWSPCFSLEDALKLDDVRKRLREGDVDAAARLAKVLWYDTCS